MCPPVKNLLDFADYKYAFILFSLAELQLLTRSYESRLQVK